MKLNDLASALSLTMALNNSESSRHNHCVKSVRIRSYSGPYFSAFGLNAEWYLVSLRIHSECGKIRSRITLNIGTFYAVNLSEQWLMTTLSTHNISAQEALVVISMLEFLKALKERSWKYSSTSCSLQVLFAISMNH